MLWRVSGDLVVDLVVDLAVAGWSLSTSTPVPHRFLLARYSGISSLELGNLVVGLATWFASAIGFEGRRVTLWLLVGVFPPTRLALTALSGEQ